MSKPTADELRNQLRNEIRKIYSQITEGCGRSICSNQYCASNPLNNKLSSQEAQKQSIILGKELIIGKGSSFTYCNPKPPYFTYDDINKKIEEGISQNNFVFVKRYIGEVFAHEEALNQSFLYKGINGIASNESSGVNLNEAKTTFKLLIRPEIEEMFVNTIARSLQNIKQELRFNRSLYEKHETLRQFIVLLQNPLLFDFNYLNNLLLPFGSCILSLPNNAKDILSKWITQFDLNDIKHILNAVQSLISMRALQEDLVYKVALDEGLHYGAEILQLIWRTNNLLHEPILYNEFYNDAINERLMDSEDLAENYILWRQNAERNENKFTCCTYYFMLNPYIKSRMLFFDSKVQQYELRYSGGGNIFNRRGDFILRVERDYIVRTALAQVEDYLERDTTQFKRQLRVKFVGEEGIDEGGLQKEFFQLIVKELFDENFGMFTLNNETHKFWIKHTSEDTKEFTLIGVILGLAIYNGVILDIHFPDVMYKKLMGVELNFDDVKELQPSVWNGFKQLMEYTKDDMEEVFSLHFQVSYDYYGQQLTYDLKENGGNILVNQSNKQEYVQLYSKWLLEDSVKKQFTAFYTGFRYVCDGIFFDIFRVEEVEQLVCGDPELDFKDLEKVTVYDGGYKSEDNIIKNFWDVIHSLTHEQKKKFLFFTTGSDRAPIGGLKNLQFVITKHGEDNDRLPQAHTCFNVLLLPPYSNKEKLKERLLLATENATGFGML